jgi:hypothetical protein
MFRLPPELIFEFTDRLGYYDAAALRQSCTAATRWIPFGELRRKRTALKSELMSAELADYKARYELYLDPLRWASAYPGYAPNMNNLHRHESLCAEHLNCYVCLKTLPRDYFTLTQLTGSRSLGHSGFKKRFCIGCGRMKHIWSKGDVIGCGKHTVVICRLPACDGISKGYADPELKRNRVCSQNCLSLWRASSGRTNLKLSAEDGVKLSDRPEKELATTEELMAMTHTMAPSAATTCKHEAHMTGIVTASTRGSRCQRCWAVSHTERPVVGSDVRLCADCVHAHSAAQASQPP